MFSSSTFFISYLSSQCVAHDEYEGANDWIKKAKNLVGALPQEVSLPIPSSESRRPMFTRCVSLEYETTKRERQIPLRVRVFLEAI